MNEKQDENEAILPYGLDELIAALRSVLISFQDSSVVLYIRNGDEFMMRKTEFSVFQDMIKHSVTPIFIMGSVNLGNESESPPKPFVYPFLCSAVTNPRSRGVNHPLQMDESKLSRVDKINIIIGALGMFDAKCEELDTLNDEEVDAIKSNIAAVIPMALAHHLAKHKICENNVIFVDSLKSCLDVVCEPAEIGLAGNKALEKQDATFMENTAVTRVSRGGDVIKKGDVTKLSDKSSSKLRSDKSRSDKSAVIGEFISLQNIDTSFDDIGALNDIKETLREALIHPLKNPHAYDTPLVQPSRGLLLFGPPGTGKTSLAKALAKEAGVSFLNVSPSSFLSSMFGESSRNVQLLFSRAQEHAPCIVFIDEIDGLLAARRPGEENTYRAVKNEFMASWDGISSNKNVFVLGATNRPMDLDEGIIRRLEVRIYVGLPRREEREAIIQKIIEGERGENIEYEVLARLTENFSASDLKMLCKNAAMGQVRETIQSGEQSMLKMEHFYRALENVTPTCSSEVTRELELWNKKFGGKQISSKLDESDDESRKETHFSYYF